ncbi:helix-turn-helix domain-containing protein [Streptomyces sp. NPDC055709]
MRRVLSRGRTMQLRDRERFTELLHLKGMSQRQLAKRARVSQAFISMLARGQRGARPETGWRIASALDVYSHELFTVEPARQPRSEKAVTTPQPPPSQAGTRPCGSPAKAPDPSRRDMGADASPSPGHHLPQRTEGLQCPHIPLKDPDATCEAHGDGRACDDRPTAWARTSQGHISPEEGTLRAACLCSSPRYGTW